MALSSKLWSLSKEVIKRITEYKNSGKAVIQKRLYVKSKVTDFKYDKGNISYGKSFKNVTKDEWDIKDQYNFIEKKIKNLKDYKEVVSNIEKTYKANKSQADFWLSSFIQTLTHSTDKEVTDEELVECVTNFICDLNKSPFTWQSKVWIDGVWLEDDKYQLTEQLIIRKPQPIDLEGERPLDLLVASIPRFEPRETSSAILELAYRTHEQPELSREFDVIIGCLRLFKVGSIYRVKSSSSSKSILNFGGSQFSTLSKSSHYKYQLENNDIEKLKKVLETLKPKLIDINKDDGFNPVGIALQRYEDAILGQGVLESRITSVITCLEALFLKSDERTELSSRLSQRTAVLLSVSKYHPIEVHRDLVRAYEIRSTFIHGSLVSKEKQQKSQDLVRKILDYARLSLLIFLTMQSKIEKVNLINKIDNSLLDVVAKKALEKTLKEECGPIIN